MSFFPNDTLRAQIERGEVFFVRAPANLTVGSFNDTLVITGTKATSLNVTVEASVDIRLTVFDTPTLTGSPSTVPVNMNFASSNTIETEIGFPIGLSATGTNEIQAEVRVNSLGDINPLSLEGGVILKANTMYMVRVLNTGSNTDLVDVSILVREL